VGKIRNIRIKCARDVEDLMSIGGLDLAGIETRPTGSVNSQE
jgi:hypothetical protein